MPKNKSEEYTRADRDLLIELKTQMGVVLKTSERLEQSLGEIKDNVLGRVEVLEKQKANETEILRIYDSRTPQWKDFSTRLESLETNKVNCSETNRINARVLQLEVWKEAHIATDKGLSSNMKLIIYIGLILVAMLVWHLTGYKI